MNSLSKSFTAQGVSGQVVLRPGEETSYSVSGTFTGIVRVQKSVKGDAWLDEKIGAVDTGFTGIIKNDTARSMRVRFRIDDEKPRADPAVVVTGTAVCAIAATVSTDNPIGARAAVATLSVTEKQTGPQHQTLLRLSAFDLGAFGDEAGQGQYAGAPFYTFPEGSIEFESAVIQGSVTLTAPAIDTWAGSIGVGTTKPTDHQDAANKTGAVQTKVAIGAATAKVGAVDAVNVATALTESGARWLDGTATAVTLSLNVLVTDDALHDNTITGTFTGTILLTWKNLGDN